MKECQLAFDARIKPRSKKIRFRTNGKQGENRSAGMKGQNLDVLKSAK
jgi:hypothetical protein